MNENSIVGYHFHYYYLPGDVLDEKIIDEMFNSAKLKWPHLRIVIWKQIIGPHTLPFFEIDIIGKQLVDEYFIQVYNWSIVKCGNNLSGGRPRPVLLHPVFENDSYNVQAHTIYSMWLSGEKIPLNISKLEALDNEQQKSFNQEMEQKYLAIIESIVEDEITEDHIEKIILNNPKSSGEETPIIGEFSPEMVENIEKIVLEQAPTLKKSITKIINRIDIANEHEIVLELDQLMERQKNEKHSLPSYQFFLIYLAKILIDTAATQTSNLKKVLPYIHLCCEFSELLECVIGYIHTRCIFTNPSAIMSDISNRDDLFNKFKNPEESEFHFRNRMRDMVIIYALIIQHNPPKHGHDEGWEWLECLLKSQPTCFTLELLESFIGIAGYSLYQTYQSRFSKLLNLIEKYFLSEPPIGSDEGSQFRLSHLIEQFNKKKKLPKPSFL